MVSFFYRYTSDGVYPATAGVNTLLTPNAFVEWVYIQKHTFYSSEATYKEFQPLKYIVYIELYLLMNCHFPALSR